MTQTCILIGAPVDSGKRRRGCLMGPDAYRVAGLRAALDGLGHRVRDMGNLTPAEHPQDDPGAPVFARQETIGWTYRLIRAAEEALPHGVPIFLGGDHSLSLGSVAGAAAHAARVGRPLFVLWLDAHSDFHMHGDAGADLHLETDGGMDAHGHDVAHLHADHDGVEADGEGLVAAARFLSLRNLVFFTAFFGLSNRMANFTAMRPNDEFYLMGRVPR